MNLPQSFVLGRVPFQRGEIFDPGDLELLRDRLYKSGLVSSVSYEVYDE